MRRSLFTLIIVMSTLLSADSPVKLTVTLQTPHPGFRLEILRVDRVEDRTHVLARIHGPEEDGMMFPMVISEVSDTVFVREPVQEFTVIVVGRTWGWGDEKAVDSPEAYAELYPKAVPVPFTRTPPARD